ncbi:MAG: class I SAM-dependent methyltransferase [Chloroflexota bacterium]
MSEAGRGSVTEGGPSAWSDEVARYYDRNTGRFLLVGSGRGVYAMHRELWGPGVTTARDASDYVHRLLADEIADRLAMRTGADAETAPTVLDFGCGVGGTLFHLADRFPRARLAGVTVSARQVDIARGLAERRGVAERCSFLHGDFQTADLGLIADAVVAVESFAHSESASAFAENAARHLRPGGTLLLVDDFVAFEADALDERRRAWLERFRRGWLVPAICTVERFVREAGTHGLVLERRFDLTPLVRPGSRARDRLSAAVSPLLERLGLARFPFCGNMIGGNALQVGLREGFLRHELLILRQDAPGVSPGAPVA